MPLNEDTTSKVRVEALRSLAFGGIGAAYAVVGPITTDEAEIFRLINATDVNVIFSIDGATDHFILFPNTFLLYDVRSDEKQLGNRTQFWVKAQAGLPSSGSVYIEVII